MAASILQRCLGSVKVIHKNGCLRYTARRWLLSAAYTDTALWEAREKDPQNLALLANFMDRLYDRNFPVSSLTMSRFVDNISSREEVDQAEYYLYKFRHSPNCWYLRDWTVHSWVRQCLKYGAKDKAMHTLKNKVQYGVFPDEFTFNLLIDSFIKDDDFKGACSVVEEVMLQESLERPSTQLLCLYAASRYLDTKPALGVEEQRALGAGLLIAGLKQQNSAGLSAQLMGCSLLGKVELSQGVHALFRGMPLLWTPGYVARGLVVMETVSASSSADVRLSKDALDHMEAVLQEACSEAESSGGEEESESSGGEEEEKEGREGEVLEEEHQAERAKLPHYSSRFKELRAQLEVQAHVEPSSLGAQVSVLVREALAGAERSDLSRYQSRLEDWEADRKQLILREAETRERAELEKRARLAAKAQRQQQ